MLNESIAALSNAKDIQDKHDTEMKKLNEVYIEIKEEKDHLKDIFIPRLTALKDLAES